MKINFDAESDVLSIETSKKGRIDHAEQLGPAIVHLSKKGKPLIIEILDASHFISSVISKAMKAKIAA